MAHSNLKLKRSSTKRVLFPQPVFSQSLWERHRLPKPGARTASLSLSLSPQQLFLQQVLLFLILYLLESFPSVHPIATTLVHAHHPLWLASCSNLLISLPCKGACSYQSILSQKTRMNFLKCTCDAVTLLLKTFQWLLAARRYNSNALM